MNGKKKKYEKQLRKEEALQKKKQKKAKRRKNREYTIVSYFFVLIFVSLIGYMAYFNIWERDAITSSPYNSRQNQAEDRIVRGSILSSDGQALAYTQVDDQGNETRIYPYGNMFAHVVGYEANGRNGLESLANSSLMSTHHEYVDRLKNEILELKNPGDNVVTTLNTRLQEVAYNALGGYNGAVVVMDPKTGAVLASVSKPDFDPNTVEANWDSLVNDSTNSSLLNRATQGAYPPGSIFKIVTALTYLREHGTLDDFSYNCTGSITQEGHTIPCIYGEVHGQVDFTTAFAESCNTAFVQMGLDLGADDYVTKPFTPMELMARVNSQMRRYRRFMEKLQEKEAQNSDMVYTIGGLEVNESTFEVRVDDTPVKMTPMEFKILLLLIKNPGRVFSADEIYERVWNERAVNTETVMVHVRNIREKIEINPKEPKYLKVVWGVGYKIEKLS